MSYRITVLRDNTDFNFTAVLENEYADKVTIECSSLSEVARQLKKAHLEDWRIDLIVSSPVGR